VRLEEDFVLQLPFLLPEDNYSCDIVRGVPGGLLEFLQPLQAGLAIKNPPKKTHPKKPPKKTT
jgi:afadin